MVDEAKHSLLIGAVNVIDHTNDLVTTQSIRDLPTAQFTLDAQSAAPQIIDYVAPVQATVEWNGTSQNFFGGLVTRAQLIADSKVEFQCQGGLALTESIAPQFWGHLPIQDQVRMACESVGLDSVIEGIDDLPLEPFQIVVPVAGVAIAQRMRVGDVHLLPNSAAALFRQDLATTESDLLLDEADGFALAYSTQTNACDAEQDALAKIDTALHWITAEQRCGYWRFPDGGLKTSYDRAATKSAPRRLGLLSGRGVRSDRRWMRETDDPTEPPVLDWQAVARTMPPPRWRDRANLSLRPALQALHRAATVPDTLGRVTALSEAIEFYTSRHVVPHLYDEATLGAMRSALAEVPMSDDQRTRADKTIGFMNDAPLFARFCDKVRKEGVPILDAEIDVLRAIRRARNKAVHGRAMSHVTSVDLDHAISIVARVLIFSGSRRATNLPSQGM